MEKTKEEVFQYMEWKEQFPRIAMLGGLLLVTEVVLSQTRFRKLP
jgi:hypothetical protein